MARTPDSTSVTARLGGDAEARYTPNGKLVINFSLASNRWQPGNDGDKTVWYKVTVWGNLAESMASLMEEHDALRKGDLVQVTGQVEAEAYTSRDGDARANLVLTAREIFLLGKGNRDE